MGQAKLRKEKARVVLERVRERLELGLAPELLMIRTLILEEAKDQRTRLDAMRLIGLSVNQEMPRENALEEVAMAIDYRWPREVPDPVNL